MDRQTLIEKLSEKAIKNSSIEKHWYIDYNIKQGLRNEDGTGVKTTLTEVSSVVGYKKEGDKKTPLEGRLIYRGIEITDLVNGVLQEKRHGFEETAYLLMFGELPNKDELNEFSQELTNQRALPEGLKDAILQSSDKDVMNQLQKNVLALHTTDPNPNDISLDNVITQCIGLIAKFPTMIAYSYQAKRHKVDKESLHRHHPSDSTSIAENFLYMLRDDKSYTQLEAQILDMMLILHAEHGGGNNSTFTTQCVASTNTDTYSVISAALGSLKGPLHGGANAKVMEMMDEIKENVSDWKDDKEVADYIGKILRKEKGDGEGKIYGMGHAVYTKSDPRAELLQKKARELAGATDRLNEFNLYMKVAELTSKVFKEIKNSDKVIAPNVDFYSGFVYDCLGFPREIYTPLFAMARIIGWVAHRIEGIVSKTKLIRPAAVYVGPNNVSFTPLENRV